MFLVLYVFSVLVICAIKEIYGLGRSGYVVRSLYVSINAASILGGMGLWLVALLSTPLRFLKFTAAFFLVNYIALSVLNGLRIGFDHTIVYVAAYWDLENLAIVAGPICTVIIVRYLLRAAWFVSKDKKPASIRQKSKAWLVEMENPTLVPNPYDKP